MIKYKTPNSKTKAESIEQESSMHQNIRPRTKTAQRATKSAVLTKWDYPSIIVTSYRQMLEGSAAEAVAYKYVC